MNHFQEALGLVASAQRFAPKAWNIVIYDLVRDLTHDARSTIQSWCKVTLRNVTAAQDFRFLTNSAWKPAIIGEQLAALPKGGIVLYSDASGRFAGHLPRGLLARTQFVGVVGKLTNGPVAMYTHPQTIQQLAKMAPFVTHGNIENYTEAPIVCGCATLWSNTKFVREVIFKHFASCATHGDCILPKEAGGFNVNGAKKWQKGTPRTGCFPTLRGTCHRGDQSVLSTLLYEAYELKVRKEDALPYVSSTFGDFLQTHRNELIAVPEMLVKYLNDHLEGEGASWTENSDDDLENGDGRSHSVLATTNDWVRSSAIAKRVSHASSLTAQKSKSPYTNQGRLSQLE